MSWRDIWQVALATIASAGGVSAVILVVIKFSSNIMAERLTQKYNIKLNESLEKYKAQLDNGNHVSRAVFDREFEYYQAISKALTTAFFNFDLYYGLAFSNTKVISMSELNIYNPKLEEIAADVNKGKAITEIQLNSIRNTMLEQLLEVKKLLTESAPFIEQGILEKYKELYNSIYKFYTNRNAEDYKKILDLRVEVRHTVRKYLTDLTVIN